MNIRALLPFALLASALALSACGNKGPLLPPPAPEDDEWPAEPADADTGDDAKDDAEDDAEEIESGVDGEGDDPPADGTDDDGDGAR